MDLEPTIRLPKRPIYAAALLDECQRFAEILTDGQWSDDENSQVSITRSFKEVFGEELMIDGIRIPAITVTTEAHFSGDKERISPVDDDTPYVEELYTLRATVKEALSSKEVPEWILEKISDLTGGADADDNEDDDEEDTVIDNESTEPGMNLLSAFDFEREVEMIYMVDDDGVLVDQIITYRYYADEEEIDSISYSWSDSMRTFEPSAPSQMDIEEMHRKDLSEITEEEIVMMQMQFDRVLGTIQMDSTFDAIEAIDDEASGMYLSEADHCRRAIGMLALAAHRISGMRL